MLHTYTVLRVVNLHCIDQGCSNYNLWADYGPLSIIDWPVANSKNITIWPTHEARLDFIILLNLNTRWRYYPEQGSLSTKQRKVLLNNKQIVKSEWPSPSYIFLCVALSDKGLDTPGIDHVLVDNTANKFQFLEQSISKLRRNAIEVWQPLK